MLADEVLVLFRKVNQRSSIQYAVVPNSNSTRTGPADLQPPELLSFLSGRVGRFSALDPSLVVDPTRPVKAAAYSQYPRGYVKPGAEGEPLEELASLSEVQPRFSRDLAEI